MSQSASSHQRILQTMIKVLPRALSVALLSDGLSAKDSRSTNA